jgi:uncharacterized protein (DUF1800 family)
MQRRFLRRSRSVIIANMWWSRCFATATIAALAGCASSLVLPAAHSDASATAAVPRSAKPVVTTPVDPAPTPAALADARHVLNRLAFGPRPGEVERVARGGTQRWISEQLAGPEESPLLEAALVPHRAAFVPAAQLVDDWLGDGWESETRSLRELRKDAKPQFDAHVRRLATAQLTRDILSSRQLEAVMTDFWANHFNVFAAKGLVRVFEGDYLERALRPHALGKFSELLLATARHPAMLIYLDNAESKRETTRRGKRRGGLNENYARELLELHTLGVDGGYTQHDVQEVARILTGWSVVRMREGNFDFVYRKRAHDSGAKTVLGETFAAGGQEEEGVRLLAMLAQHPATAKHVARRLCARFVADHPPQSCVGAAAHAYATSGGDIRRVISAIVDDQAFWSPQARGNKLKTPLELVASAARALDARPDGSIELSRSLERLGEPLLQERVPTGYPDSAPEWASGGGMLARMSFASQLAADAVEGLEVPWNETLPLEPDVKLLVERLGARLFGAPADSPTLLVVREELASLSDPSQQRAAAVALLIGSPEFQRQ